MEVKNIIKVQAINRHRMHTDGDGVTTLIGLPMCPLKCEYCINKDVLSKSRVYTIPIDKFVDTLMQDYCYFVATGGGITLGGGEPLLQSKQIIILKQHLPEGIKLNIETSLNVPQQNLLDIINLVDELIIDIKSLNPEIYKEYTSQPIDKLVDNLNIIVSKGLQHKCKIRIPNIPNYTTKADIDETKSKITQLGFTDIDTFDYIIKENSK